MLFQPADERQENEGGSKNLNKTAEELMSKKELSTKISQKKSNLAPVIKELKALREEIDVIEINIKYCNIIKNRLVVKNENLIFKSITGEYETRKAKYDKINAGYESNRSQLEGEVRSLVDDYRILEARYHYFNSQKLIAIVNQKRAQDEVKLYTKNGTEKSFR